MDKLAAGDDRLRIASEPGEWGWGVTAALYAAEGLLVGLIILAYRAEGKAGIGEFLRSRPGVLVILGSLALGALLVWAARECRRLARGGSKRWIFPVVMNGFVVLLVAVTGEVGLRLFTVHLNSEDQIAGKLLYPRQWETTAANFRSILKRTEIQRPFWVSDPELGWVIDANAQGQGGLYASSAEGLRSAKPGEVLRNHAAPCRIAMIGDSFTFGEEVAYDDAWVSMLTKEFAPGCQILNFAVGGYGIDQIYLQFLRDVRPWKPDAVVLGFVNHDVVRILSVYSFLTFPGGETPFPKPRFVVEQGKLTQINRPLLPVSEVFATESIHRLPFIGYDINYRSTEWERDGWGWLYRSYIFRVLLSFYPLHEPNRSEVSDQAMQDIGAEVFRAFRAAVDELGARSLIVYLPSVEEIPHRLPWEPIGMKAVRASGVPHLDLRDCMAAGYAPDAFLPPGGGQHYSPAGNRLAASCLREPVRKLLTNNSKP